MTDDIDAIVAPRTDDPTARLVPGARVRQCAQCDADVWVAPSTFAAFKGKKMPPICIAAYLVTSSTRRVFRPQRHKPAWTLLSEQVSFAVF